MKLKLFMYSGILAIALLSGCSQAEDFLNEVIGQQTEGENNSSNDTNMVEAKEYSSDQGDTVHLPLGDKSFANSVIDFTVGEPAPLEQYADPNEALGEPDYDEGTWEGFVSLGGGGHITVEFEDAYLIDGTGDDIYLFEVGPSVESMDVEISKDGNEWVYLGEVTGGTSSLDIGPHIDSDDDQFSFVRITDLLDSTSGDSPGADLDAVAILNGVLQ